MTKFKKGDKIKRTGLSNQGCITGTIYTFEKYSISSETNFKLQELDFEFFTDRYFELVESKPKFKAGDKVRYLGSSEGGYAGDIKIGDIATVSHDNHITSKWLLIDTKYGRYGLEENDDRWTLIDENINEVQKMDLDKIKKANLAEAKKQIDEEKKNEEIDYAKDQLRCAVNSINSMDRKIKDLEEQKKSHEEIIKKFKPIT